MSLIDRLMGGDADDQKSRELPAPSAELPVDPRDDEQIRALRQDVAELRADLESVREDVAVLLHWRQDQIDPPSAARRVGDEARRAAFQRRNEAEHARQIAELDAMRVAEHAPRPTPPEKHHSVRYLTDPTGRISVEVDGRVITDQEAKRLGVLLP